jgi:uncharacterized membrane protein
MTEEREPTTEDPSRILDLRTSDVGPRTSDVGPRTPDVGPRTSDVGRRTSDLGPRTPDVGPRTPDLGPRTPDLGPRTSDLGLRTSDGPSSTGLAPRTAATLAYLAGPFSGALILLAESKHPDVRFHAWQSIVGLGGLGVAVLLAYMLAFAALFVSAAAVSVMVGVASVIWIVLLLAWAICLWKAYSEERWKLPLAGDYAERFATRRV